MITSNNTTLQAVVAHHVGSRAGDEGVRLSAAPASVSSEVEALLLRYFLSSLKAQELYTLQSESDAAKSNAVYDSACAIFDSPDALVEQSAALAELLYEQGADGKVKGGDFFVAYLKDCMLNGETLDAVGLFKSENQEDFLKLQPCDEGYRINADSGVGVGKPDKGCLIFNAEREAGFLVAIAGVRSISEEQYWTDGFLNAVQRKDDFFRTQQAIALCKNFVTQRLPETFEVTKADQADMLNKSVKFFKENDSFSVDEFAQEVIADPEAIKSFKSFKHEFDRDGDGDSEIPDQFDISEAAVKSQARALKSVIKLDKNFHIYVHGRREYISRGYDEKTGMHFYQLFFKEEA